VCTYMSVMRPTEIFSFFSSFLFSCAWYLLNMHELSVWIVVWDPTVRNSHPFHVTFFNFYHVDILYVCTYVYT
jgi:hypothetical protein